MKNPSTLRCFARLLHTLVVSALLWQLVLPTATLYAAPLVAPSASPLCATR